MTDSLHPVPSGQRGTADPGEERDPQISVVIPAFNEEQRLPGTLVQIAEYLDRRGLSHEILVADDGSSDNTASAASQAAGGRARVLRAAVNEGKGSALRRGVSASRGRWVLITDADLSTPIEDLARLEPGLAEADLVVGSRAVAEADIQVRQPLYRELMGKTFNRIIRLAGVRGIADTQCGFKLMRGDVARQLFAELVTPGFAYDVELIWLAHHHGFRVIETGVRWINSPDSRVNPLIDPLRMLLEIARFRWLHRSL